MLKNIAIQNMQKNPKKPHNVAAISPALKFRYIKRLPGIPADINGK